MSAKTNCRGSLSAARKCLRNVAEGLTSFLQGTDQAFLDTGAGVQAMERGARDLLDLSSRVGTLSAEGDDPVASLRLELTLLEKHLGASRSITLEGAAALAAILEGTRKVAAFRDRFSAIVMTLRSLASSTKVESTRLSARAANFDMVADGVRQMGAELASRFDEVLAEGTSIRDIAGKALSRTRRFLDQYKRDSSQLCAATQTSLVNLASLSTTAASLMSDNATHTQKLGADIESIFHSLQVHDIARQIIEHVGEELLDFEVDVGAATADLGTPIDEGAWMAEVMHVGHLEAAQLEDARKKLLRGLADIDSTLSTALRGVDQSAQGLTSLAGGQNGSEMDSASSGIRRSTTLLCEFMSHEQEVVVSLSAVSSAAGAMTALAQKLESIGGEARVIGLNAMVKAANVGREGLTLTVLAHAIQDASETIASCTASVEVIMNGMVSDASGLAARGQVALREQERTGEQIIARMESLLTRLSAYRGELTDGLTSLVTKTTGLRRGIGGSAGQLREMTNRVGLLQQLEVELTTIAAGAATLAKEKVGEPVRARSASKRYTMESEREVRRALLGRAAGDESRRPEPDSASLGGTIELF